MSRRSWTAHAPRLYDALMAPVERLGMGRMRAALWSALPRDGRGLEVGAGSGAGARHRAHDGTLVGIDIAPAMLARARDVMHARLVAADVQALPFADASFDWAVGSLLFCEVADPLAGLHELRRVLRPGGSLHLLEHVRPRGALLGAAARALTRLTGPLFGEHFDRVTHQTVIAAGFALERADWRLRGAIVHIVARREEKERRRPA
jgi:ubiquinone/menaquinone biosynthesis C-methylase UbiE